MNSLSLFLAQIDVRDTLTANIHKTGVSRSGLNLLFGAFGLVTLLILMWAVFIRKRPNGASRRYSYSSASSTGRENPGSGSDNHQGRRRRRRRRRPRNPTLAETGGLPPVRAEGFTEDSP